jgi:hypothetical protein
VEQSNKFLEKISSFQEELPLTFRLTKSMNSSRNQSGQAYVTAIIDIGFYESKSIEPSGFYRPISKIVNFSTK